MKSYLSLIAPLLLAGMAHSEETQLFNGKDLTGWAGQTGFWSVEDGAITGRSTSEMPIQQNTFLIWKGVVGDFELHLKYRIMDANGKSEGFGNSGIQYRSKVVDPSYSVVAGYQADMECGKKYSGILYEEKGRGILAQQGQKVVLHEGAAPNKPKIEVLGKTTAPEDIQAAIHPAEWNDYVIIAKGSHLQHFINGKLTVDVTDETAIGAKSGLLALQMHKGNPMTVQFKDMVLITKD